MKIDRENYRDGNKTSQKIYAEKKNLWRILFVEMVKNEG